MFFLRSKVENPKNEKYKLFKKDQQSYLFSPFFIRFENRGRWLEINEKDDFLGMFRPNKDLCAFGSLISFRRMVYNEKTASNVAFRVFETISTFDRLPFEDLSLTISIQNLFLLKDGSKVVFEEKLEGVLQNDLRSWYFYVDSLRKPYICVDLCSEVSRILSTKLKISVEKGKIPPKKKPFFGFVP